MLTTPWERSWERGILPPGNEGILPSARVYPPSLRRVAFKIRSTK